jgi:hypothetical protein
MRRQLTNQKIGSPENATIMKNFLMMPMRSVTLASVNAGTSSHILCNEKVLPYLWRTPSNYMRRDNNCANLIRVVKQPQLMVQLEECSVGKVSTHEHISEPSSPFKNQPHFHKVSRSKKRRCYDNH